MSKFAFLLCADGSHLWQSNDYKEEWQTCLMRRFYEKITDEGKEKLHKNYENTKPCEWDGIKCANGIVSKIDHCDFKYGELDIYATPPLTGTICVFRCKQKSTMQLRKLPRELYHISVACNHYYGSLDLSNLPPKVCNVYLWENQFEGPISLLRLPESLCILDLLGNRIVQSVVYYDNLPVTLRKIGLVRNTIGGLAPVDSDRRIANKDIVHGIKKKNIK